MFDHPNCIKWHILAEMAHVIRKPQKSASCNFPFAVCCLFGSQALVSYKALQTIFVSPNINRELLYWDTYGGPQGVIRLTGESITKIKVRPNYSKLWMQVVKRTWPRLIQRRTHLADPHITNITMDIHVERASRQSSDMIISHHSVVLNFI